VWSQRTPVELGLVALLALGSGGCAVDAGKCPRIPPIGAGTYASTGGTVESGGTSYRTRPDADANLP
jgi:hypothetical protein